MLPGIFPSLPLQAKKRSIKGKSNKYFLTII
jgi:hypothetical protein